MRILHTLSSLRPETGGPARSVPGLARALAMQGAEVHLWSPDIPDGWMPPAGVTLHGGVTMPHGADGGAWDLVHDHGVWLPLNHRIACWCHVQKVARVVSPRGMLEPWALQHHRWKKRMAWWLYQRRDLQRAVALHATAESEAEQLRKLGFKQRIIVVANGVEVPEDRGQGTEGRGQRSEPSGPSLLASDLWPPASGPRTALFLSRIHPKKGLPLLLEAWARVRPAGWRLQIVGPDEDGHRAELMRLCGVLGLGYVEESKELSVVSCQLSVGSSRTAPRLIPEITDNRQRTTDHSSSVSFSGPIEGQAKWQLMCDADLFILPTYSENFGIAVAEALACGVPVITTKGAPWAGLIDHACGWWVRPEMQDIASALQDACSLPSATLQAMGARGSAWVAQDFGWPKIGADMKAAYERLLACD